MLNTPARSGLRHRSGRRGAPSRTRPLAISNQASSSHSSAATTQYWWHSTSISLVGTGIDAALFEERRGGYVALERTYRKAAKEQLRMRQRLGVDGTDFAPRATSARPHPSASRPT